MKELILVTASIPFGTEETFLETEVKYLAKGFDKDIRGMKNKDDYLSESRKSKVDLLLLYRLRLPCQRAGTRSVGA